MGTAAPPDKKQALDRPGGASQSIGESAYLAGGKRRAPAGPGMGLRVLVAVLVLLGIFVSFMHQFVLAWAGLGSFVPLRAGWWRWCLVSPSAFAPG